MSVRDELLIRPTWPFALNHGSQQAQGLVAWWPMVHPGGARLFDMLSGRYHGTVVNNPKWSSGPTGAALDLVAASTQYASTALNTAFTDFTCIAWFYGRAGSTFARIVDKDFTNGFWLGRANSGTGSFGGGVKETGAPYGRYVSLPEHQWNHIVSRRAGTTHSVIGNGGAVSTSGTVTGAALGTQNTYIGANTIGGSPFDGMIGEVRMYDRALSDAEVWALYDPVSRYELYYPLGRRVWFIPGSVITPLAVSGAITPAGSLAKQDHKAVAGSITPAATLARQANKGASGSVAPSGSIAGLFAHAMAGLITPAGAVAKLAGKLVAGSITPTGALSTLKVTLLSLAGSLGLSGTITRRASKGLSGTITAAGGLAKRLAKALSGAITAVGALASSLSSSNQQIIVTLSDEAVTIASVSDDLGG